MSIFTAAFARAAAERAIKTTAQTAAAVITAASVGLLDADWAAIASVSGMAGLVSLLTSVGTGVVTDGSPSAGGGEVLRVLPGERPLP